MSTRYNNGSHYENHQQAAELHEHAAHVHLVAAEAHEKQDHRSGHELSRQALEHTLKAHRQTGQIEQLPQTHHGVANFGHQEMVAAAHSLWQARGCPLGSPEVDWFNAAQQLRARAEQPATANERKA